MSRRAVVIGNCQVKSLADSLNLFSEDIHFEHFQIHSLPQQKAQAHIEARIAKLQGEVDLILTFNLSDRYYGLARPLIRETFSGAEVLSISNLFFTGYHPDIIVLGTIGKRMDGAMAQYHSRLALYGFTRGMSVEETAALFNAETYATMGYFSSWGASLRRLAVADKEVDLPFGPRFVELLKERPCMYVVNHPSPTVFREWARFLMGRLEERSLGRMREWMPDESLIPHYFTDTEAWPVYPEIARHHALNFPGSYVFKKARFDQASFLSLTQFIQAEFDVFASAGQELIANSREWPALQREYVALDTKTGRSASAA